MGITPAYAGKSVRSGTVRAGIGDHPRVCGEKAFGRASPRGRGDHPRVCGEKLADEYPEQAARGSPPRMRGKAGKSCIFCPSTGITPAYAGKSVALGQFRGFVEDHPRVCGEKPVKSVTSAVGAGITPAYAGKRCVYRGELIQGQDHPRVCGEK